MRDTRCWAAPQVRRSAGRAPNARKWKLDRLPRAGCISRCGLAFQAAAQATLQRAKGLLSQQAERAEYSEGIRSQLAGFFKYVFVVSTIFGMRPPTNTSSSTST